ncbi:MAG TPA: hypothetical protein VHL57_06520, partial [Flavobacteriales bacterium]|nr:hypothetical protein [Flavobacteriales bacterium]
MIAIGFFLLVILALTGGAWGSAIVLWKEKYIRYPALIVAVAGTWFLVDFWTYDPNTSDAAKTWYGQYALSGCDRGTPWDGSSEVPLLSLYTNNVCTLQEFPKA